MLHHYHSEKSFVPHPHQKQIIPTMNRMDKSIRFSQAERSYNHFADVTPIVRNKREGFSSFSQANMANMNSMKPNFNMNMPNTERARNVMHGLGDAIMRELSNLQGFKSPQRPSQNSGFNVNLDIPKKPAPAGFNLNYENFKNFSLKQPIKKIEPQIQQNQAAIDEPSLELDISEIPSKKGLASMNNKKDKSIKKSTRRMERKEQDKVFSEILSELNKPESLTKIPVFDQTSANRNLQIDRQKEIAEELMKLEQEYTTQRRRLEMERQEAIYMKEKDNEIFRKNLKSLHGRYELEAYPVGQSTDDSDYSEVLDSFIKSPPSRTMASLDNNKSYLPEHRRNASSLTSVNVSQNNISFNTDVEKGRGKTLRKSKEYLPSIADHPSLEDSNHDSVLIQVSNKQVFEHADNGLHLFDYDDDLIKPKSHFVRSSQKFSGARNSSSFMKAGAIISSKNEL